MLKCGDRSNCPDVTRGVAHIVPRTSGVRISGNGSCAADGCSRLFLHLACIMGDTWRNDRMIFRFTLSYGGVSESDNRILEGSKA